jgi:endonuclease YncB( thermonuclease family)
MHSQLIRALTLGLIALGLGTFTQSPASAVLDRDCADFPSQAAAQNYFNGQVGDPDGLDADGNGIACESNPCPCIGRGNPNPNPVTTPPPPKVYRETGNVTQIVDGDTLRVRLRAGGIVSVRMLGINTPERGSCGSTDATDNLRKLAPVGSTVDLVSDPSQAAKDRYGRLLRYVAKRGGFKDLSYRQAWNGFTKHYVFGGKPVRRDGDYVRAITSARNNVRGLWGTCW